MRISSQLSALTAILSFLAQDIVAIQLKDELNAGWTFGLMPRDGVVNLQSFTGALGGISADPIVKSDDTSRPYEVSGSTFPDYTTAAGRSCDNQKNKCANAANASGNKEFTVGDCDSQNSDCHSAITKATATVFGDADLALVTSTSELDIFCEL